MVVRALFDANVLYSRTRRDWLLMLQLKTLDSMFVGCWTEDIMAELVYSLRRAHPQWDGAVIAQLRGKIEAVLEGGRIEAYDCTLAYEGLDPHDRHVHAAAVAGGVGVLVTDDRGLLAIGGHASTPYDVMSVDDFLVLVAEGAPDAVAAVTEEQLEHAVRRGGDPDLASRLELAGCPAFGAHVRTVLQGLALRP